MKKLVSLLLAVIQAFALTGCQSGSGKVNGTGNSDIGGTTELDTAVISCCHVTDEDAPILYVSHDKEDGMWQFLCGKEHEASEGKVLSLEEALALDPTLTEIEKMPRGYVAERVSPKEPWEIKEHP